MHIDLLTGSHLTRRSHPIPSPLAIPTGSAARRRDGFVSRGRSRRPCFFLPLYKHQCLMENLSLSLCLSSLQLFNPNQDKSTPGSGATPTAGGGGSRASVGPGSAASSTSGGARIGDGTPAAAMSLLTSSVAGGSATVGLGLSSTLPSSSFNPFATPPEPPPQQKVTLLDDQLRFLEGAKVGGCVWGI